MLKIIEADPKYLPQYEEAYIESIKQIELGNIKKHDMMFLDAKEKDIVQVLLKKEISPSFQNTMFHHITSLQLMVINLLVL